eukprot:1519604-Rhodomonas_salina.2
MIPPPTSNTTMTYCLRLSCLCSYCLYPYRFAAYTAYASTFTPYAHTACFTTGSRYCCLCSYCLPPMFLLRTVCVPTAYCLCSFCLSSYAPATRSPLLAFAMLNQKKALPPMSLCGCYATSSPEMGYGAMPLLRNDRARMLRLCYAMSGTENGYAGTSWRWENRCSICTPL